MAVDIDIRRIAESDDLAAVCAQMKPDLWGKDNEMTDYQPDSLKEFLQNNGILLIAFSGEKIAGVAICYDLIHPAPTDHSFYVHELDTHPDYRRQGIGTVLMNEALKVGKVLGAKELWVGTEHDNEPAKALYEKLGPTETEHGPIYSYKLR